MMFGIINHIVYFLRLGEEQLVISLMKENFSSLENDYLEFIIKKVTRNSAGPNPQVFSSVKPPFSHSFVYWVLDWFVHIYNSNRHLVLQSGILNKFLDSVNVPGSMIATPRFPNLNSDLIEMITKVRAISRKEKAK